MVSMQKQDWFVLVHMYAWASLKKNVNKQASTSPVSMWKKYFFKNMTAYVHMYKDDIKWNQLWHWAS